MVVEELEELARLNELIKSKSSVLAVPGSAPEPKAYKKKDVMQRQLLVCADMPVGYESYDSRGAGYIKMANGSLRKKR